MKKTKQQIAKEQIEYFNKVKEYIEMEYSDELSQKMSDPKYLNITNPYTRNCYSLKKTIPYTANEIVRFLNKTK